MTNVTQVLQNAEPFSYITARSQSVPEYIEHPYIRIEGLKP